MKKKFGLCLLLGLITSVYVGSQTAHATETVSGFSPYIVLGEDEREQVPDDQLSQLPYSAITFLEVTFPDGTMYYGSGAMVSEDTVLTAGHVLFDVLKGGWATKVRVYAGYNGTNSTYYAESTEVFVPLGWNSLRATTSYDLGAVKLDRPLGTETGVLPMTTTVQLLDTVTVTGYPGDRGKTMWTDTDMVQSITSSAIRYAADTSGGNSGCAIYNQKGELVGIHAGTIGTGGVYWNHGTRFNETAKQMIDFWVSGQADVMVEAVTLSTDRLDMDKGDTAIVTAAVSPPSATVQGGKWYSSNDTIAAVDYKGQVTAVNQGTATVSFVSDDQHVIAVCEVNVTDEAYVPVTGITFGGNPENLEYKEQGAYVGGIGFTVQPTEASNPATRYVSSDTSILDFTENGLLSTFKKAGTLEVSVQSLDNLQRYKARTICVDDHGATFDTATDLKNDSTITSFFYNRLDLDYLTTVPESSGTYTFSVGVGENLYQKELNKYWELSVYDETGTTIGRTTGSSLSLYLEQGKRYYVLPKLMKYAHIDDAYYTTQYDISLTKKIIKAESAAITNEEIDLFVGEELDLVYKVLPENAEEYMVEWRTSDDAVAMVDPETGTVTAKNKGAVTLSLTIVDKSTEVVLAEATKELLIKEVPVNDSFDTATSIKVDETVTVSEEGTHTRHYKFEAPETGTYYFGSNASYTSTQAILHDENRKATRLFINGTNVKLEKGKHYYITSDKFAIGEQFELSFALELKLYNQITGEEVTRQTIDAQVGEPLFIVPNETTKELTYTYNAYYLSYDEKSGQLDPLLVGKSVSLRVSYETPFGYKQSVNVILRVTDENHVVENTIETATELPVNEAYTVEKTSLGVWWYKFTVPEAGNYHFRSLSKSTSNQGVLFDENNTVLQGLSKDTDITLETGKTYYYRTNGLLKKGEQIEVVFAPKLALYNQATGEEVTGQTIDALVGDALAIVPRETSKVLSYTYGGNYLSYDEETGQLTTLLAGTSSLYASYETPLGYKRSVSMTFRIMAKQGD